MTIAHEVAVSEMKNTSVPGGNSDTLAAHKEMMSKEHQQQQQQLAVTMGFALVWCVKMAVMR